MSAHTPGPWHWSLGKFVVADDGQHVADTYTVADARLIAAAPRMRELIKNLASGYWDKEETAGWPASLVNSYRNDARAILRDVEGDYDK